MGVSQAVFLVRRVGSPGRQGRCVHGADAPAAAAAAAAAAAEHSHHPPRLCAQILAVFAYRQFGWRLLSKFGVDYRRRGSEGRMEMAMLRNTFFTAAKLNLMLAVCRALGRALLHSSAPFCERWPCEQAAHAATCAPPRHRASHPRAVRLPSLHASRAQTQITLLAQGIDVALEDTPSVHGGLLGVNIGGSLYGVAATLLGLFVVHWPSWRRWGAGRVAGVLALVGQAAAAAGSRSSLPLCPSCCVCLHHGRCMSICCCSLSLLCMCRTPG